MVHKTLNLTDPTAAAMVKAVDATKAPKQVTITYDSYYDEYQVRAKGEPLGSVYFTSDKEDAVGTAKAAYGDDCRITHRRKKAD